MDKSLSNYDPKHSDASRLFAGLTCLSLMLGALLLCIMAAVATGGLVVP